MCQVRAVEAPAEAVLALNHAIRDLDRKLILLDRIRSLILLRDPHPNRKHVRNPLCSSNCLLRPERSYRHLRKVSWTMMFGGALK